MKRIAILGASFVKYPINKSSEYIYSASGDNLGNFLFRYALESFLENHELVHLKLSEDPKKISEECDFIVIPSANQLNAAFDLEGWAKFIEGCSIPIIAIGLGAQAANNQSTNIPLTAGSRRYFDILSEKCPKILVRGQFTQDCLEKIGITNTEVFACPSNLINAKSNLGDIIAKKFSTQIDKLNIGSCEISGGPKAIELEKTLIKSCVKSNGTYTIQAPFDAFSGAWDNNPVKFNNYFNRLTSDTDALLRSSLVFSSAQEWLAAIRSSSHSIGMRIHGTIAPLQAEVPSVCIPHDSRTTELARTLKLPHVQLEDAYNLSIQDIIQKGQENFSASAYNSYREKQLNILQETFAQVDATITYGGIPIGFDWQKYLAKNIDLTEAGINSAEGAKNHWLTWGRFENRAFS